MYNERTINGRLAIKLENEGHAIVAVECGGWSSFRKGSNTFYVIDADMRENKNRKLEHYHIFPGAKMRYRSQGTKNVITYKE